MQVSWLVCINPSVVYIDAVRHLFVVYREDQNMLRLQPKLKRHMWVLILYLTTVA